MMARDQGFWQHAPGHAPSDMNADVDMVYAPANTAESSAHHNPPPSPPRPSPDHTPQLYNNFTYQAQPMEQSGFAGAPDALDSLENSADFAGGFDKTYGNSMDAAQSDRARSVIWGENGPDGPQYGTSGPGADQASWYNGTRAAAQQAPSRPESPLSFHADNALSHRLPAHYNRPSTPHYDPMALLAPTKASNLSTASAHIPLETMQQRNGGMQPLSRYQEPPQASTLPHEPRRFEESSAQPQLQFTFDYPGSTTSTQSAQAPLSYSGSADHFAPHYSAGAVEQIGMGGMLDSLHNVEGRTLKRQKINPASNHRSHIEFGSSASGGALAAHIKEQGAKNQNGGVSAGQIVLDLEGDSEDSAGSEPQICYGRVKDAAIQCSQVPTPKPGTKITPGLGDTYWPAVKIVLRRRQDRTSMVHAIDGTRGTIGTLDSMTAIGLVPLLDQVEYSLRTTARILTRKKNAGDPPPGSECSLRFPLDLNLIGPKSRATQVGRFLLSKQISLIPPLLMESGLKYENPQTALADANRHISTNPDARYSTSSTYQRHGPPRTIEEERTDLASVFDSLHKSVEELPELNADPLVTTELLRHQKQGLWFMMNKEKDRIYSQEEAENSSLWRMQVDPYGHRSYKHIITELVVTQEPPQVLGGILADMMGLGKTLSILSLVCTSLDQANAWAAQVPGRPDLVELKRPKAGKLENAPQAKLLLNCKTTLLLCPLSVISNWEEQISTHIKTNSFKYYVYHGSNRIRDIQQLAEFDLIITTYACPSTELGNRNNNKSGANPLEQMNFFRIVLDEAHQIREQKTQQFKAACRLQANRRWACTGTPIQNRLEDLGALLTFLRFKPFDGMGFTRYILGPFKASDETIIPKLRLLVDSITLRRLKDKINLPKRVDRITKISFSEEELAVYQIFEKNASDRVKVISGNSAEGLGGKSYVHILQAILRLRLLCAHGKDLLCDEDLKMMDGLSKDSAIDLESDDFDDKPGLSSKEAYDMYRLMRETNADNCLVCQVKIGAAERDTPTEDQIIGHMTPCYHILCNACIGRYKEQTDIAARGRKQVECITCAQGINVMFFPLKQNESDEEENLRSKSKGAKSVRGITNYAGPHSKTKALVADLLASEQETVDKGHEEPIKSVVFSGWTSHLDLIQFALDDNGIPSVRLDGKMSRVARAQAIEKFREDRTIRVILVSISAGGLGLNLTTASKVYVMEPQYNPAAEAQAIDRVHRLGQRREVETVRYIMERSMEEKMLMIQDKKTKLANLSMSNSLMPVDPKEARRRRLEDFKALFN